MPITRVGTPTVYEDIVSGPSISGTFTLANGSTTGRFVEARCALKDNNGGSITFASCTFNGVAGVEQIEANDASTNQTTTAIYTFDNAVLPAAAGTYTVVATSSDASTQLMFMEITEYSGGHATTLVAGVASAIAFGLTSSLTPSPATGNYQSAIFACSTPVTTTVVVDAGTQDENRMLSTLATAMRVVSAHATAGTIGVTFSANGVKESGVIIGYNEAVATGSSDTLALVGLAHTMPSVVSVQEVIAALLAIGYTTTLQPIATSSSVLETLTSFATTANLVTISDIQAVIEAVAAMPLTPIGLNDLSFIAATVITLGAMNVAIQLQPIDFPLTNSDELLVIVSAVTLEVIDEIQSVIETLGITDLIVDVTTLETIQATVTELVASNLNCTFNSVEELRPVLSTLVPMTFYAVLQAITVSEPQVIIPTGAIVKAMIRDMVQ